MTHRINALHIWQLSLSYLSRSPHSKHDVCPHRNRTAVSGLMRHIWHSVRFTGCSSAGFSSAVCSSSAVSFSSCSSSLLLSELASSLYLNLLVWWWAIALTKSNGVIGAGWPVSSHLTKNRYTQEHQEGTLCTHRNSWDYDAVVGLVFRVDNLSVFRNANY